MGKKSSISCDKYQDMIYDYFSDALSEEQIEKLENHISSCPTCRSEFEQLRTMLCSLEQFEDRPIPVGYTTSLHTKLLEASQEIQDRRAHRFKYFCKDFITDGKWKVAAPAVVAVALLVGVFSTGLFQDFIHTDDGIVTDNIQSSQEEQNRNASDDTFGLRDDADETASPRTTLRPRASASPTARASSARSTARSTSRATSNATSRSSSRSSSSGSTRVTNRPSTTTRSSVTNRPTTAPTEEPVYPEIGFNDSASLAQSTENTNVSDPIINEHYEEPSARNVEESSDAAEETAPTLFYGPQQAEADVYAAGGNSGGGGGSNSGSSSASASDSSETPLLPSNENTESEQMTVYYVHHDDPETFIKEYGFSNFTVDQDGDYHVQMTFEEFNQFKEYADEHGMKIQWLNDGENDIVDLIITKSELKDEETIAD